MRPKFTNEVNTGTLLSLLVAIAGLAGVYAAIISSSAVSQQRIAVLEKDRDGLDTKLSATSTGTTRAEVRLDGLERKAVDTGVQIAEVSRKLDGLADRLASLAERMWSRRAAAEDR